MDNKFLLIGYQLDGAMQAELEAMPEAFRALYLKGKDPLVLCCRADHTYLGKALDEQATMERVRLLKAHLITLLKKLFPKRKLTEQALFLIAEDR